MLNSELFTRGFFSHDFLSSFSILNFPSCQGIKTEFQTLKSANPRRKWIIYYEFFSFSPKHILIKYFDLTQGSNWTYAPIELDRDYQILLDLVRSVDPCLNNHARFRKLQFDKIRISILLFRFVPFLDSFLP